MRVASIASAVAISRAAAGSAHHHAKAEFTSRAASATAARAADAAVRTPSPRSALAGQARSDAELEACQPGQHHERCGGEDQPERRGFGMRAVDERTDGLHADVERDDQHRERDPRLRPPFETFCRDRIVALRPEAPHEHDRGRRVEQRGQSEPGQRKAAVDDGHDESRDADGAVPPDREVGEPERGDDELGPVADRLSLVQRRDLSLEGGSGRSAEVVDEDDLVVMELEHTDLRVHEADDVGDLGRTRERSEDAADGARGNVAVVFEQADGVVQVESGGRRGRIRDHCCLPNAPAVNWIRLERHDSSCGNVPSTRPTDRRQEQSPWYRAVAPASVQS